MTATEPVEITTAVTPPPEPPAGARLSRYLVQEKRLAYPRSWEADTLPGAVGVWVERGTEATALHAVAEHHDGEGTLTYLSQWTVAGWSAWKAD